jgi:two-component system NarL family sensor kinase
VVRLGTDEAGLHCEVLDDGGHTTAWRPGVGIAGMRERVAQLGGSSEVGPGPRGGEVRVCLPTALA